MSKLSKVRGFTLIELMITVAIIGVLAAVATPTLVDYIRESKCSEVPINLKRCYQGVVNYFHEVHGEEKGEVTSHTVPKRMANPICPGKGRGSLDNLSGSSGYIDPRIYERTLGSRFKDIGFILTDATYACYSYDTDVRHRRGVRDGDYIRCIAYTDVDDDDKFALWHLTATYRESIGTFQAGAVYKLPSPADDW